MTGFWQAAVSGTLALGVLLLLRVPLKRCVPMRVIAALWDIVALRLLIPLSVPGIAGLGSITASLVPAEGGSSMAAGSQEVAPIAIVWLIGAFGSAAVVAFGFSRETRMLRTALPPSEQVARRCRALLANEGHFATIRVSDRISTAVACGIFRKRIVLPKGCSRWDDETLRCVLMHEYVHLKRGDNARRLLMLAAVCINWFNPLAWLGAVASGKDIETACDECSVMLLGTEHRTAYAGVLVNLAEEQRLLRVAGRAFSRGTRVAQRVRDVLRTVRWSAGGVLAAVLLSAIVLSSFASGGLGGKRLHTPIGVEAVPFSEAADDTFIVDEGTGTIRDLNGNVLGSIDTIEPGSVEVKILDDTAFHVTVTRTDAQDEGSMISYIVTGSAGLPQVSVES